VIVHKTDENQLAIGNYVVATVSSEKFSAESDILIITMTAAISPSDSQNYKLVLTDIAFYDESDQADWGEYLSDVWEYRIGGGAWISLTTGDVMVMSSATNASSEVVELRIKSSVVETYILGTLRLSAALKADD
jgi:hypothetical protein